MSEACKHTSSFSSSSSLSPHQQLTQNNGNKLVYLDKKFISSKEAAASSSNSQHYMTTTSSIVKIRPSSHAARSINQAKRLSCEELEDLKEKFVDFIKLDSPSPSSSSSCLPPPPLELMNATNNSDRSQQTPSPPLPPPPPPTTSENSTNHHRLSILSAESIPSSNESSSSSASSSLVILSSTLNSNSSSSSGGNRPEPPQRTVSIRTPTPSNNNNINNNNIYSHNSIYSSASIVDVKIMRSPDDSCSIKSGSIYSTCRLNLSSHNQNNSQNVRNSRSVFSIYEEESGGETTTCSSSSGLSSASSTSSSSSNSNHMSTTKQMERLSEHEVKKIESMYRSIGSIVCVSPCTCDLYTTTSEQIASMLNNCWKLELSGLVPIWIYDTGFNLKRVKKLALMLVDRRTAFPLIQKPIVVSARDLFRNPNGDKQITFTLTQEQLSNSAVMTQQPRFKEKSSSVINRPQPQQQLVGLVQFVDFLCCHEFFKFYKEIVDNPANSELFDTSGVDGTCSSSKRSKESKSSKNNKSNSSSNSKTISHSMMSLNSNRLSDLMMSKNQIISSERQMNNNNNKANNRYSEYISSYSINYDQISLANSGGILKLNNKSSSGAKSQDKLNLANSVTQKLKTIRTITKSCISNPCAFQHVNSLKSSNNDQIRLLIDNYSINSNNNIETTTTVASQVRLRKK